MNMEPIPSFRLDIKQDIPERLRLAEEKNESLEHTKNTLIYTLLITGVGLCVFYIYGMIEERKAQKEQE